MTAKLSQAQVDALRAWWSTRARELQHLGSIKSKAAEYGVSRALVEKIVTDPTYRPTRQAAP